MLNFGDLDIEIRQIFTHCPAETIPAKMTMQLNDSPIIA
jgi:hypothetical protein